MNVKKHCVNCKHEDEYRICVSCVSSDIGNDLPSMFEEKKEEVNHPSHYDTGKFECIEVMIELFGINAVQTFCLLNAYKYLWRCDHKASKSKDIEKARWYLEKHEELEIIKKNERRSR